MCGVPDEVRDAAEAVGNTHVQNELETELAEVREFIVREDNNQRADERQAAERSRNTEDRILLTFTEVVSHREESLRFACSSFC